MLQQQSETRRIILFRGSGSEVWLSSNGTHRALPQLEVARWQRVTEHLTARLTETLGHAAVSLFSFEATPDQLAAGPIRYEVMEELGSNGEAPLKGNWGSLAELDATAFRDSNDLSALWRAVAQCNVNTHCCPFGKLGWFEDVRRWVREVIEPLGMRLVDRFRQLNASPAFSLIRFETEGPAVWFKAVGQPNLREYSVTLALARLLPRFLPRLIAARPEWNGWLALEADGTLLADQSGPAAWVAAAHALAELQIDSLGKSLHLLEAGARDLRPRTLADRIEPFFPLIAQLMQQQAKVPPKPLSRDELQKLSACVLAALTILEDADFPSALGSLDINPGNLVCTPTGSVFLDWAEAFVGHPFLTFQYFLEHFRRIFGETRVKETQLVASYCSPWLALVSDSAIRRALEAAPLAAVFAYATRDEPWTDPRKLNQPRIAGYLRSLTRRMDCEARTLARRNMPCPSL